MVERITQSTTLRVPLQAYLSTDHITPATGKTIAITISKNGAAYGNPSGGATNATEIASGSYYVDLSTTDTGTLGPLFVLGIVTGIDNVVALYDVVKATNIEKNVAYANFMFVMTDSTTHAPKTGLTVAATRSLDGGAFASCANSVTEIGGGTYAINLAATDTNANNIMLQFTAATADQLNIEIITTP